MFSFNRLRCTFWFSFTIKSRRLTYCTLSVYHFHLYYWNDYIESIPISAARKFSSLRIAGKTGLYISKSYHSSVHRILLVLCFCYVSRQNINKCQQWYRYLKVSHFPPIYEASLGLLYKYFHEIFYLLFLKFRNLSALLDWGLFLTI